MSDETVLDALSKRVDDVHYESSRAGFWQRLRPSELGHECSRYLWLSYRWATQPERPPGRTQRIFNRGSREEDRLIDDIRSAGVTVLDRDESTGKQWPVELCNGHVFGWLDGAAIDSDGLFLSKQQWHVLECKSHSERSFKALERDGIQKSQPKHYAQMQLYMLQTGMEVGLYAARNKNTEEDRYIVVSYNKSYAERLHKKAQRIIDTNVSPERISADPHFHVCRYCAQKEVCHGEKLPLRNCRTCLHSKPIEKGQWMCGVTGEVLTKRAQEIGCESHRWLPTMINGDQLDADPTPAGGIRYRMRNGATMIDMGV